MIMSGEKNSLKEWKQMDQTLKIYGTIPPFYKPEWLMTIWKSKWDIECIERMEIKWTQSLINNILGGVRSMMNG